MRRFNAVLSAVFAITLAGCLDLDEEYSINPDGSGKVKIKCALAPMRFTNAKKSPEELLKSDVRETLEKCGGVDAWTDVSAVQRDDGKIGVMDYYNMKNLQADTSMRQGIAGQTGGADGTGR